MTTPYPDCAWLTILDNGTVVATKSLELKDHPSDYDEPTDYIEIHTVVDLKHLVKIQKIHYFMRSMVFYDRIASIKDPALRTLMHRIRLVENMYAYAFTNIVFDKDTTDSYMKDWLAQHR